MSVSASRDLRRFLKMLNFKLNDGNEIPAIGFGVFMIEPNGPTYDARRSARAALSP